MFFLFIIIGILFLGLAIHTSKIGIEVENLILNTENSKDEIINKDSKIYVYILLFGKIKFLKKNVRNMKIKNVKFLKKDMDIKIFKDKNLKIDYKELIRNIQIDVKQIDLKIQIGIEDAALTAMSVGVLASILGVILKKPRYQIIPIYSNKNLLKVKLNGIFTIYLMHYIYIIFKKKRRVKQNERTSNRKSYANSYE